jgi:AraC-like DNA-binding protein/ligand-binding sensor protein
MQTTFVRQETVGPAEAVNFNFRRDSGLAVRGEQRAGDSALNKEMAFKNKNPFAAPNSNDNRNRALIEALRNSKVYQEYERAFGETTGLPVALNPVESWQLPHHGGRFENAFCAMISQKSRACSACLQLQQSLLEKATNEACTMTCQLGKSDTAMPVKLGDRLIGFLHTGQIFRKKPTESQFDRVAKLTSGWGLDVERKKLREAYFSARVLSSKEHESAVKLLTIFAQHLSMLSNQVLVQQGNSEPPVITRAKEFIHEHQTEELTLGIVAKAVNTSTFYFCKMFKKVTGINYTDYLSRVRIEKSKNLLLNPNLRVSEIAFEVGFQSLTHFNRVFKKILGQSPTEYRTQLLGH